MARFRVMKGETLFQDEEDSVSIHYLQKQVGMEWQSVFQLTLESGRSWGDQIDLLYTHCQRSAELLIHVSGYGYWGDTEYFRSLDDGDTWEPTRLRREPAAEEYTYVELEQV